MDKKKKIFLLIFAAWLLIILGFIGYKQYTVSTGEKILLKTVPVDPRDILRGDYVVLNYEINRLDLNRIPHDTYNFSKGDSFYLVLKKGDKYWQPEEIRKDMPQGVLFVRGTINWIYGSNMGAEYGIENYFVPEGAGIEIEKYTRGRSSVDVDVEAYVDKYGNSVISKIYINNTALMLKS